MSTTLTAPDPVYGYPPSFESSLSTFNPSKVNNGPSTDNLIRTISRTPSPTPSEYNLLHGIKEEKTLKEKIKSYGFTAVVIAIAILFAIYTKDIVKALKPETNWLHDHPAGALIPIAILIIISFPPVFGILLGEVANFFTFKYACSVRAKKFEAKNMEYGLLAHVVRNGSFWVILIIRYSTVPSHFATAVFATVGVKFWIFFAAAVLSLPTQFVPAYVGYCLQPSVKNDETSKTVENVVLGVAVASTIGAHILIQRKMKVATPDFIYARRKARQANDQVPLNHLSEA
ncbi:hypothetical protein MVEN_02522400 [Mycena venus]|uniref:Golgi apparatus membrane protein TVP38 n=1 Tax=Mycena venus TaxID=2733690 RepID=A0A8H6WUM8_9AGAR|nr:hypothetical protein MVEN_02522400 [Mycena venus]